MTPASFAHLTAPRPDGMLVSMRAIASYPRLLLVILAAFAFILAAPIHASHDHANDPAQTDGPCVICKSLSTASAWTAPVSLSPQLQPVGVLVSDAPSVALAAPTAVRVPRAPPLSFV